MNDRVSTYPGRVTLTPVAGKENTYDMTMADEPTQEGTPPTKANLLNDFACKLVGVETTSVPSDAFSKLALGTGKYGYGVTVLFNGSPLANAVVTGISPISGSSAIVTDSNGLAIGVSTSSTVSIKVTPREINLSPKTISVTASTAPVTYTTFNIDEMAVGTIVTVNTSGVFSFTSDVTSADFCLVGAGGGGDATKSSSFTQGGGGGSTTNVLNVAISSETSASVTIGASGAGGVSGSLDGKNGGTTSLTINGSTYTATGGGGSSGTSVNGGIGGYGSTAGGAATVNKFADSALGRAGGGGGGGGGGFSNEYSSGGSPYGGYGSYTGAGNNGYGFGGGGGAARGAGAGVYNGGSGYAGGMFVRWRKS